MIVCDGCEEQILKKEDGFELTITNRNEEGERRRCNAFDLCSPCRERVKQFILVTLHEKRDK